MDYAALVRRHRLEGDSSAGGRDAIADATCEIGHSAVASLLVPRHVEKQTDPIFDLPRGYESHQVLEGSQCLSTPPNEQTGVFTVDVEHRAADVLQVRVLEVNDRVDSKLRYQGLQDAGRNPDDVRGSLQQRHADLGWLASNAEDAGLAAANDVYFDFRALCVELL